MIWSLFRNKKFKLSDLLTIKTSEKTKTSLFYFDWTISFDICVLNYYFIDIKLGFFIQNTNHITSTSIVNWYVKKHLNFIKKLEFFLSYNIRGQAIDY